MLFRSVKNTYFPSTETYCIDVNGTLKVYKNEYTAALQKNATHFEDQGNYSAAAYAYNELAKRYKSNDSISAKFYEQKAYVFAAKHFKIITFDSSNTVNDLSAKESKSLQKSLRDFQLKNGLPADGKLTLSTSLMISNFSEADLHYLFITPREYKAL